MLPQLRAEQQLLAIEAASVPHMEKSAQAATVGRYQRRIDQATTPARSAHEALLAAGVPVKHVPKATGQPGTTRKAKHG